MKRHALKHQQDQISLPSRPPPLQWPEVLRQVGVALTLVPEKKVPRRNPRFGLPAHKVKVGELGEDAGACGAWD